MTHAINQTVEAPGATGLASGAVTITWAWARLADPDVPLDDLVDGDSAPTRS